MKKKNSPVKGLVLINLDVKPNMTHLSTGLRTPTVFGVTGAS